MKTRAGITQSGLIALPAGFRRRWGTSTVLLDDQGDRLVVTPLPDDPVAVAEGALADLAADLDVSAMRRRAREDEQIAERRRLRGPR